MRSLWIDFLTWLANAFLRLSKRVADYNLRFASAKSRNRLAKPDGGEVKEEMPEGE